jgi:hypothetical protein
LARAKRYNARVIPDCRPLLLSVFVLSVLLGGQAGPQRAVASEASSTQVWYVMDREGWLKTDDTRLVVTTYDLRNGPNLRDVPYRLGDWTGEDYPITNLETFPTLDAEQLVHRSYTGPHGRVVVLSLIGSTKGQSFHHPLICYEWAHWPAEDHGTTSLPVGASDVVLRVVIGRDPAGPPQVDLHWYLWPNDRRNWGDGATQIRVTALATEGEAQGLADAREFARLFFADARRMDGTTLPGAPAPVPTPAPAPAESAPLPPSPPEIPTFQ